VLLTSGKAKHEVAWRSLASAENDPSGRDQWQTFRPARGDPFRVSEQYVITPQVMASGRASA
jgi:hypothetical protein